MASLCRQDEYESLKKLMSDVDPIQNKLFHDISENTRLDTVMAILDIQQHLETRVEKLFEEKAQCSEELDFIKFSLM